MKKSILALSVSLLFLSTIVCGANHSVAHAKAAIQQESGSLEGSFLDADFLVGKVIFKSGTSTQQKLNYHFASNRISFMNEKGEYFALANLATVEMVTYGDRSFVPINKGDIAELMQTFSDGSMLLLERKARVRKMDGAYGTSSTTASTHRLSSAPAMGIYDRLEPENAPKPKVREVFLLLKDGKRHTITRLRSLRKLFKPKWDAIKAYDKEHKPDFKNRQDLIALLEFCVE